MMLLLTKNLVSHAVKYTSTGDRVMIEVMGDAGRAVLLFASVLVLSSIRGGLVNSLGCFSAFRARESVGAIEQTGVLLWSAVDQPPGGGRCLR